LAYFKPVTGSNFTTDLFAHYKFDGNCNDSSGNGRNGTAYGSPTYDSNLLPSIVLDGLHDYVQFSDDSFSSPRTIAFFVDPQSTDDNWIDVLSKHSGPADVEVLLRYRNGNYGSELTILPNYYKFGNPTIVEYAATSLGGENLFLPRGSKTFDHFVERYDGVNYEFWINGYKVFSYALTGTVVSNSKLLTLGAYSNNPSEYGYFKGSFADIRIYTRALTDGEIKQLSDQYIGWKFVAPRIQRYTGTKWL
jgi:hypothetical protein